MSSNPATPQGSGQLMTHSLPSIDRFSGASDIRQHIQAMQKDLRLTQEEGRQSRNVRLLSDVFSWKSLAERDGQLERPAENDDNEWKTIPEFYRQCEPDMVTLAFFSTYYAPDSSTSDQFTAHAWVGIALRVDHQPYRFATAAWDPDYLPPGQQQASPTDTILMGLTRSLPNLGFFLKREDQSDKSPMWYGARREDGSSRRPQDCSEQCLAWLGKVCRGELRRPDLSSGGTLELTFANMRRLGFQDIGMLPYSVSINQWPALENSFTLISG